MSLLPFSQSGLGSGGLMSNDLLTRWLPVFGGAMVVVKVSG